MLRQSHTFAASSTQASIAVSSMSLVVSKASNKGKQMETSVMPVSTRPLYRELACLVQARINCIASGNTKWENNHTERIDRLVKEYMPSGSGIDSGTAIDLDVSTQDKLVFHFAYHHMDDVGYYDDWTQHRCVASPSLAFGLSLEITGKNRNQIKEYLHEVYQTALTALVPMR